jgi:putative ABC transport system permease protein
VRYTQKYPEIIMILKFAIRTLSKRPFLNLVKILGLSLSLSGILLIVLFLKNELTYDCFHQKYKRIYRLTITDSKLPDEKHFARIPGAKFVPEMKDHFPEIENYVRLAPVRGDIIKFNENYIKVNEAFQCDSTFFKVFDAELVTGDPANILNNPGSIVVSQSFAKKIFGNTNPIGQILTLPEGQYYGKNIDLTIKGIMKDFPQSSHFHPEFIATPIDKSFLEGWAWSYILLTSNANPNQILSGFKNFYASYIGEKQEGTKKIAHLQNISAIHLYSDKLREIEANSSMSVIYTLSIAAFILLLIALTNYASLNTGMVPFSEKYLFIGRVSGSSGWMNLKYLFNEGILICIATFTISISMVALANLIIQKYFALNLFTGNMLWILSGIGLFGLLTLIVGILPFFNQVVYKIKPAVPYSSNSLPGKKGISKGLIVFQYSISISLIIAVFVIHRQTDYALKSRMGTESDNLICFEHVHSNVQNKFEIFKTELLKYSSVASVSGMLDPPGGEANDMFRFTMEDYVADKTKKDADIIGILPCDYSFANIFNLDFLGGTNFSEKNVDNDGSGEYIINESAMRRLHYTNPDKIIGKRFGLIFGDDKVKIPGGKIIGVVKDFHLSSIKKKIEPIVLFKRNALWLSNFVVLFKPGMEAKGVTDIKKVWTKMFPEYPLRYEYVGTMYKNIYKTELLQTRLLSIFTFIALFICTMGLLGLSLLTTQRRTKEIGIRKVNGAKVPEMMLLLNWDFIKWIMVSFVLATPFAYFAMNKWLENYAYKTALHWWIFAASGLLAIIISLLTVSVNSLKTATRNPVEALRYE